MLEEHIKINDLPNLLKQLCQIRVTSYPWDFIKHERQVKIQMSKRKTKELSEKEGPLSRLCDLSHFPMIRRNPCFSNFFQELRILEIKHWFLFKGDVPSVRTISFDLVNEHKLPQSTRYLSVIFIIITAMKSSKVLGLMQCNETFIKLKKRFKREGRDKQESTFKCSTRYILPLHAKVTTSFYNTGS